MNQIRVLFFATLRDRAGVKQVSIEMENGARVSDLKATLADQYPSLNAALPTALASVNREYAFEDDILPEGAEVAFFPPVSGGQNDYPTVFSITKDSIDLDHLLEKITLPTTGAACIFTGTVRAVTATSKERITDHLVYEAYLPMAERKMEQVAQEIRNKWPSVEGIAIVQRIGRLDSGTPTVVIACSAAHRDSGVFEAARYGIDRLKEIVPIWKKEVGPDGEMWIEGEYIPRRVD